MEAPQHNPSAVVLEPALFGGVQMLLVLFGWTRSTVKYGHACAAWFLGVGLQCYNSEHHALEAAAAAVMHELHLWQLSLSRREPSRCLTFGALWRCCSGATWGWLSSG
jgi:hypothetical protein